MSTQCQIVYRCLMPNKIDKLNLEIREWFIIGSQRTDLSNIALFYRIPISLPNPHTASVKYYIIKYKLDVCKCVKTLIEKDLNKNPGNWTQKENVIKKKKKPKNDLKKIKKGQKMQENAK